VGQEGIRVVRFRRRFGVLVVATVGAILGSVLSASAASAAVPGLVYVSSETLSDSQVFKAARVFCPPGLQVIGGAYELSGAEGAVVLDDFIPSADNLLVSAGEIVGPGENSDGTTASWKIRATAVCANPLPGYSIQTSTSTFRRATDQTVLATCPAGKSVVGGGASLSNGFGQVSTILLSSGTAGVLAEGHTDVDGYSGSWSITAYAICANLLPGWHQVQQLSPEDVFLSRTETAFCPPNQVPIGVGWRTFGAVAGVVDRYFSRANISTGPNPGVTVSATGPDNTAHPWQLSARAVCVNR
jgi:hypothetical protein